MAPPAQNTPDPAKGLPPVVAPSGRFIAQLFLVPGLIVAGAVVVLLGFTWLAGGPRSPDAFLRDLRSANPDIRWRTASDLAQVLRRDDRLATNVDFGLKLAELLKQAVAELARKDKIRAERAGAASSEELAADRLTALAQRHQVQYLTASVGSLLSPVGAPVLADLARQSPVADPLLAAQLRWRAVWALASLGERLRHFEQLADDRKSAVLTDLDELAKTAPGEEAAWAKQAAAHLRKQGTPGVVPALVACASADDHFLRAQTAHALTFWDGTPDENQLIEATLLKLARDDGHGTVIPPEEQD
jgi:hypothetical protein